MKKIIIIGTVILVLIVGAILTIRFFFGGDEDTWICSNNQWVKHGNPSASQPTSGCGITTDQEKSWQGENIAVSGKFADADVIATNDGKYRLYYSEEPDTAGFSGKIYSSISSDGINWTKEDGVRKEMATFPDVIKLPNGQYRMYFQNSGVIKSAISTDGLTWQDEQGTRVDDSVDGFILDNVAASTTTILDDASYLMVYRGTINEPYGTEKLPNQFTQLAFYATSLDGLNFIKRDIAVDSRNSILKGLLDGPDFINWNNNELRLYFWTYSGVYHVVYQNGQFGQEPLFDYSNSTDTKNSFPSNPAGDPTIIKISDLWFMYYGQHAKGIYFTEFE
ncbi:MAG: hypothetical protein ACD_58C00041G0004 [uncultured bacterium]|nr:MAG: hypothetical protein ACD_58C00041G0004 [uncultured bacterium]